MRPSCVDNAAIQVERARRTNTPAAQNIRCVFHVREQKVQQQQKLVQGRGEKKDPAPLLSPLLLFPPPPPPPPPPPTHSAASPSSNLRRWGGKHAAPRALCVNIEYFGAALSVRGWGGQNYLLGSSMQSLGGAQISLQGECLATVYRGWISRWGRGGWRGLGGGGWSTCDQTWVWFSFFLIKKHVLITFFPLWARVWSQVTNWAEGRRDLLSEQRIPYWNRLCAAAEGQLVALHLFYSLFCFTLRNQSVLMSGFIGGNRA